MAIEFITYKDANGVSRSIAVDAITGGFVELLKVAFGADGSDPTMVSAGSPLPVTDTAGATAAKQDAAKAVLDAIAASVDDLEGFTDGLEGLETTIAGRLAGATPHPSAANTTDVALTSVAGRLMSFSCAETTGSAGAKFYLRDGTDSTGTIVAIVTLAAGESVRDSFGPNGIALAAGLWLDRVSGTTEVTAAVA